MRFNKRALSNFDWQLLILLLCICCVGLVVLYSAGFDVKEGNSAPMERQLVSMVLGLTAYLICMFVNPGVWRRAAPFLYVIGCVMLVAILTTGIVAGGARRWLSVGGVRIQPSEFMKLATILLLARIFSGEKTPRQGYSLLDLFIPCLVLVIPVALILDQPDLGTALTYLMIGGSMLLVAGVRLGTIVKLGLLAILLAIPAWNFMLHDYQRQRVLTFLSPEMDPLGSGYHAMQSKIAVGSGAVTGKGFLKGTQTQLRFLPEQTTDFIFSVFAEEWGFVGSLVLIGLYFLLILRVLQIASRCSDTFPLFVACGVAAMLFWHLLVNIGMVIGIMPVVGITLTLMSFGGSSVVTVMAALGIVSGISTRRFMFA